MIWKPLTLMSKDISVWTMSKPYMDHIESIFCYFYYIFASTCQKGLKFSLTYNSGTQEYFTRVQFSPYGGQVGTTLRPLFCIWAYQTIDIFSSTWQKMFSFHWLVCKVWRDISMEYSIIRTTYGICYSQLLVIFLMVTSYLSENI